MQSSPKPGKRVKSIQQSASSTGFDKAYENTTHFKNAHFTQMHLVNPNCKGTNYTFSRNWLENTSLELQTPARHLLFCLHLQEIAFSATRGCEGSPQTTTVQAEWLPLCRATTVKCEIQLRGPDTTFWG